MRDNLSIQWLSKLYIKTNKALQDNISLLDLHVGLIATCSENRAAATNIRAALHLI